QLFQHVQACFVSATVSRAPQTRHTRSNRCKGVSARRTAQTHCGGRSVLLVLCVQNEDTIQGALYHIIYLVVVARCTEHHAQEVTGVAQVVTWVHQRLTQCVLVRHCHQCWHFRDQTNRRNTTVF